MNLFEAKIYNDGSHWIAIPHTERPYRQKRRRKNPEKSEELQQFEERFEKVKGKRKSRKAKLLQEFTPMFKDEGEAAQFVEEQFNRLSRNLFCLSPWRKTARVRFVLTRECKRKRPSRQG